MYTNVKLILKDEDKNLKAQPIENYSFASNLSQCIIGLDEIFKASLSYPIVFIKGKDKFSAMTLMSLENNKNLFIDKDGKFIENNYIPAHLRKYPFIFVQDNDTLHLAYDSDCQAINKKSGQALFDQDGKNTAYLDGVLKFLNDFQNTCNNMDKFIKELDDAKVLEDSTINVNNGKFIVNGFLKVNEEKLNNLDKYILRDLVKSGAYKLAIAHLLSYNNLDKLTTLK